MEAQKYMTSYNSMGIKYDIIERSCIEHRRYGKLRHN